MIRKGDHAASCHGRSDIISRHDRVRDTIMTACSSANLSPVREQKHLRPEKIQDQATCICQVL